MAKNKVVTVKVATDKAIAALEDRLAKLKADYVAQEEKERVFKKEYADWKKKLVVLARKALLEAVKDEKNIDTWLRNDDSGRPCIYAKAAASVPIIGDIPDEPIRNWPSQPEYQYRHVVEEVEQAIRILKMTDEKTVPASTFAALSRYL
jgi:hypothetical protein